MRKLLFSLLLAGLLALPCAAGADIVGSPIGSSQGWFTRPVKFQAGTYYSTIRESTAEGLSGSDLRIGLDETLRMMVVCDQGDVAADMGLSVRTQPSIVVMAADKGAYQIIDGTSITGLTMYVYPAYRYWVQATVNRTGTEPFVRFSTSGCSVTETTSVFPFVDVNPVINQSGTGGYIGLRINPTETATGSGAKHLIWAGADSVMRFGFDNAGIQTNTVLSALTNTAQANLVLGHNTSGTPAADFGSIAKWQLESSTTADQDAAAITVQWATATHASRAATLKLSAYETTNEQVGFQIIADSGGVKTAVNGVTPVVQAANIADPTGGATQDAEARTAINAILDVIQNFGLMASP